MTSFNESIIAAERERRNAGSASKAVNALLGHLSAKQREFVENKHRFKVAVCPRRCLAEGTLVATPTGPVAIESLQPGDTVYDEHGLPIKVKGVFNQGVQTVHALTVHGRPVVECTENHKWLTRHRRLPGWRERAFTEFYHGIKIERREFMSDLGNVRELHAYALGALLGDGCSRQGVNIIYISSEDTVIPRAVGDCLGAPEVYKNSKKNYTWAIANTPPMRGRSHLNTAVTCNHYDSWCRGRYAHEKIADLEIIKTWDRRSCLEFLAGILDTDGTVGVYDNVLTVRWSLQAKSVIDAIKYLGVALWGIDLPVNVDNRSKYKNGPVYSIGFNHNYHCRRLLQELGPFIHTPRKQYKSQYDALNSNNFNPLCVGVKVSGSRLTNTYDIEVDSPTHLYLLANGLVTHNSGKSRSICAYLIKTALEKPKNPVLYLGVTRDSAKAAVWDLLVSMLQDYNIGHEARPSALTIRLSNGSLITLFGADATAARDRLRGRKFALVCVDEGAFTASGSFDQLIYSLLPALADYRGTLAMASSPGEIPDGLFYHAYQGDFKDNWRQFHWDLTSNPHFMGPAEDPKYANRGEEELDTICRLQFGGNRDHPSFMREYLGKYVKDDTRLIYPYSNHNLIETSSLEDALYGIGIDFGVSTDSAIVVGKYSQYSKEFHIVDSWSEPNCSVDELAAEILDRQQKYKASIIVADAGGLGAASIQELRRRYAIPIKAADKTEKTFFARLMRNDLQSGLIKCVKGIGILDEWDKLVRDDAGEEKKGQKNHQSDAGLYIWRYAHTYYLKHASPKPTEDQRMIDQLVGKLAKEKEDKTDNW